MTRRMLRLPQISERTGVPIGTLRYLRFRGEGPPTFVLAGRVVAFEDDVDEWIKNAAQETGVGAVHV